MFDTAYVEKLVAYFRRVAVENAEANGPTHLVGHWQRGVILAEKLVRLMNSSAIAQAEIVELLAALSLEKSPCSGWLELQICARWWARQQGCHVSAILKGK